MKSILGALLFDEKPKLPELDEVSLSEAQRQSIAANLASIPGLEKIAGRYNRFLSDEIAQAAERIMPGYSKLLGTGTEALQSAVEGNLPEGVTRNLRRTAAEYGVGSGTVGSSFNAFGAVNLLGRESLNYSLNALNTAERWLSQARSATPLFNMQSSFISPAQQFSANQYNQQTQFQYQWMKNQLEAAPEGWEVAVQGLLDWVATTGSNVVSMYAGGAMGGGGGMGGMMGGAGGGGGGGGTGSGSYLTGLQQQLGSGGFTSGGIFVGDINQGFVAGGY